MKIGNPADKSQPPVGPTGAPATNASAASATSSAIPTTADASAKIALSDTASALLVNGDPAEFDAGKVDKISKSIEDGSFKVNHEVIADKLISNAQELLSKVQS